jgi:hypothetical protein
MIWMVGCNIQVNPALPNVKIEVLGPPTTSGTRDAFAELVMEAGCNEYDWLKEWKKKNETEYKRMCQTVREDGPYVEAGENDNLIVQKLRTKPNAFGIFGYGFLDANRDQVMAATIEKVTADADPIADGAYPMSRPLFFYVKKAQVGVIPGVLEYIEEFTSEKAWGDEGYLVEKPGPPAHAQGSRGFRPQATADEDVGFPRPLRLRESPCPHTRAWRYISIHRVPQSSFPLSSLPVNFVENSFKPSHLNQAPKAKHTGGNP